MPNLTLLNLLCSHRYKTTLRRRRFFMKFLALSSLLFSFYISIEGQLFAKSEANVDIDVVLSHFENQCFRLEQASLADLKTLLEMDQAGYFSAFCKPVSFQTCADFNDTLKPYGQLTTANDGSCKMSPNTKKETLAGN